MGRNQADVIDKTVQTTNIWLDEISDVTGPGSQRAWHVLGAVLRTLRDRIPLGLAAHLSAELPILVRGLYFDRWRPTDQPERYRTLEDFLGRVRQELGPIEDVSPRAAAEAVFATLTRHVSPGQVEHVREALPEEMRAIWRTQSADGFDPLEAPPVSQARSA